MKKNIIIIGAGVAGLSTGIYARKNGYAATVYEAHYLPGGMCTSWKRKGFMFEGCLHYIQMVGASPEHVMYPVWEELGVLPRLPVIRQDLFHAFRDRAGRTLVLYKDVGRLEAELVAFSPADRKEIKRLCGAVRRCAWFVRSAGKNPFRLAAKGVNILRGIPNLKKYGDLSLAEYAARFRDPLIRRALSEIFVYPDFAYVQLVFYLAGLHIQGTAFPKGGSLALARTLEARFLELGGRIEYRKRVRRIGVRDGRATGIALEDGTEAPADIVISAADGHATLFDLLEDRFTTAPLRKRYASQALYHTFVQVSLGINRDMSGHPHVMKAETATPFEVAGVARTELWYQHYAFDPAMAPPGKTVVTVLYPSELSWWRRFEYRSDDYKEEKKKILETTVTELDRLLPGIAAQIEARDVATPYTTRRYTGNWKGATGFIMDKTLSSEMTLKTEYTLPGVAGFYMTGQWVKGFGVPISALSGKEVIRKICRDDKRRFRVD